MTKQDAIRIHLSRAGFEVFSDFTVVKGPKAKPDIIECWNCEAFDSNNGGKKVLISSGYTMTSLRYGLRVIPNQEHTCLYGQFVAVPLNYKSPV